MNYQTVTEQGELLGMPFPESENDKWGYKNKEDKFVIAPQYEIANKFSNNLAAVKKDGSWMFITPDNERVFDRDFEEIKYGFIDGLSHPSPWAKVKEKGKWGYINLQGEWVIKPLYDNIYGSSNNQDLDPSVITDEMMWNAEIDGKWGILNSKGEWIVKPSLNRNELPRFYYGLVGFQQGKKFGIKDYKHNKIIEKAVFDYIAFDKRWVTVKKGDFYGLYTVDGTCIFEPFLLKTPSDSNAFAVIMCDMVFEFENGLVNGETPLKDYIDSLPEVQKSFIESCRKAYRSKTATIPLHKYGDGFTEEENNERFLRGQYRLILLSDGKEITKAMVGLKESLADLMLQHPECKEIYYSPIGEEESCYMSETARKKNRGLSRKGEVTLFYGIREAINNEENPMYKGPSMKVDLTYNDKVIKTINIGH